jgi:hypothetical protein
LLITASQKSQTTKEREKMNPLTERKKTVILPLAVRLALIVFAALIVVAHPVKGDQSVKVVEKRQRSVTEDPAVKGEFAKGW